MLYILEHYTVNWREGGDSVEYHIGTSLMNLADALTDALDTLEEHNRHEEWCEDAKILTKNTKIGSSDGKVVTAKMKTVFLIC